MTEDRLEGIVKKVKSKEWKQFLEQLCFDIEENWEETMELRKDWGFLGTWACLIVDRKKSKWNRTRPRNRHFLCGYLIYDKGTDAILC